MTTIYNTNFTQANAFIERFKSEPLQPNGGDLLTSAIETLRGVDLNHIENGELFKVERKKWLSLHLEILGLIDQSYNPNEEVTFYFKVLPPDINGISYPFPIDPEEIEDSAVRAEYEQKIAENDVNKRKSELYSVLEGLLGKHSNFDPADSYIEGLKRDISLYYTKYADDKVEFNQLIEDSSLSPEHKAEFVQLLTIEE